MNNLDKRSSPASHNGDAATLRSLDAAGAAHQPGTDQIDWQDHLVRCQSMARIGSWEANITGESVFSIQPVFWSDEFYRIIGYTPGEVAPSIEVFFNVIATQKDLEALRATYLNMLHTGEPFVLEHAIITKTGEKRFLYNKGQLIYRHGKPYRMVGTTQDITDQRLTNDQLAATGKKLKDIFNNMKELFFSVHVQQGTTLFISAACEEIYGFDQEAFMNDTDLWFKCIVEEDRQRVKDNTAILERGDRLEQEYRIRHKDGSMRWIESVIFPTLDAEGKLLLLDGFSVDITKRKLAENALRDSETRFRSLIQNTSDVIAIANAECEIMFATDSLYKVMGYRPEEIIGRKSYEFIYKDDYPALKQCFEDALANPGKPLTTTYRRVRKDGTIIWCEGTANNLLHLPEVGGVVINFRDITARKEVEQALRDSETKFRSLIQNSSDAIVLLDKHQRIVFASDAYYRITGYTPDDIYEKYSFALVHPDDIPTVAEHKELVLTCPGKPIIIRYRRKCQDGSFKWVESIATNMLHRPEINAVILNQRDISDAIEAEEALKHSESKLKALINQSSDAITITGADMRFKFCNDSLFRMSGYSSLEEFNRGLVHPEDVAALKDHLQWLVDNPGQLQEMTFRIKKKDGSYIWVERVSINKFDDPAINGILSNFRDITERRLYLEALQQTNSELSKTNMELDKFVYRVSHDLRAPLLSIQGLIEVTRGEHDTTMIASYLDMMNQSVQKLDKFILDILDYSKNTRTEVRKEQFDLHALVEEIITNLRFINKGSAMVSIENGVPEKLLLESDRSRLSVILNNLISNSIRYSDTSRADAFVQISAVQSGSAVEIAVHDNGIGIAPAEQEKVFGMFYRGSTRSNGSGLGLYIVKETVERLGGNIKLLSALGEGTTFTLTLE